jgi:hypothetical protein
MTNLMQVIVEKFLAKLSEEKSFEPEKTEQLRAPLIHKKKLKPEEFVQIFAERTDGALK